MANLTIWDLKERDGRPRFYAPGDHPATWRSRQMLKKLEALPPLPDVQMAIEHISNEIAMFEERENRAKVEMTHWLDTRH